MFLFTYSVELYKLSTIENIIETYKEFIAKISEDINVKLEDLNLYSDVIKTEGLAARTENDFFNL